MWQLGILWDNSQEKEQCLAYKNGSINEANVLMIYINLDINYNIIMMTILKILE